MEFSQLIELLTGRAGALVLSLFLLYMIYRGIIVVWVWVSEHVPVWVNRHLSQIDEMLKESKEDRKIYHESMIKILEQFDALENEILRQGEKIDDISKAIRPEIDK